MKPPKKNHIYGVGAEFDSASALLEAAARVRKEGYSRFDAHSPLPIHGMSDAMGLGPSRVSAFALAGGILGALFAFGLVYYAAYLDFPLVVQGKPYFAFEPTFPIFFELIILATAFAALLGMLIFCLLPRYHHPAFNWDRFERVTDDGFFLIIEAAAPAYSEEKTGKFLETLGGRHITPIPEDAE